MTDQNLKYSFILVFFIFIVGRFFPEMESLHSSNAKQQVKGSRTKQTPTTVTKSYDRQKSEFEELQEEITRVKVPEAQEAIEEGQVP